MPLYEYECLECEGQFEIEQSIKDDPLEKIEDCKSQKCNLKKLISLSSFRLKGGGWYKDGYSSNKE